VTSSDFPNRETFIRREEFCLVLEKLHRTCNSVKREILDRNEKYQHLCISIQAILNMTITGEDVVGCENNKWNPRALGLDKKDPALKKLEDLLFVYAKHNLAVVNIYIKDPVVTRIQRDQKIPVISFVANTGGLLGLCMGFSLVSLFEVIYYLLTSISSRYYRNNISMGFGCLCACYKNMHERRNIDVSASADCESSHETQAATKMSQLQQEKNEKNNLNGHIGHIQGPPSAPCLCNQSNNGESSDNVRTKSQQLLDNGRRIASSERLL
jgi:hypothetical protein